MKRQPRFAPLLCLFLSFSFLLTACGGGGDEASGSSNPSPLPPGTVGAAGGTVTGPRGAQVLIPAGALSQNVVIAITQSSAGAPIFPAGVVTLGPMFAFEPHGTTFATPATITIPFDPALLPAGRTVTLYKTTAGNAAWELVNGATITGSSISAPVSSFSYLQAAAPPPPVVDDTPWRWWEFGQIMASNRYVKMEGNTENLRTAEQEAPGEMLKLAVFGDLTLHPVGSDDVASGEIYSTANGRTYWAEAEAPIAVDRYAAPDTTATGAKAVFIQKQSYRKDESTANLSLTITQAFIEAADYTGSDPVYARCPGDEASVLCRDILDAEVEFHILVVQGAQGDNLASRSVHHWKNGLMKLQGFEENWFPSVYFSPQAFKPSWDEYSEFSNPEMLVKGKPLWKRSQFELRESNSQVFTLIEPLVVPIDLEEVREGDEFTLDVRIYIKANNRRAYESYLKARLRDPVNANGVGIALNGLTPTNRPLLGPITLGVPPAFPACTAGDDPEAGTIQFAAPNYMLREFDANARIIAVTRTGGTRGSLRATVSTRNGTGVAGTHYQQVTQIVEFEDGDDVARVIGVPVINNNTEDGDVTVNLTLTAEENCGRIGTQGTAVLTIIDDEYTPPEPGPSGQLDTTFDNDGKVTTAPYGGEMSRMVMTPGNQFVIVGGSFTDFIAARFNADGSPDTTFGGTGRVTTDVAGGVLTEYARAVALQPDGKLVVAGHVTQANNSVAVALVRYHADGTLDTGFSGDGKVIEGGVLGRAFAVAVHTDGKILVAGDAPVSGRGADLGDMLVARFNSDGSLDTTFGTAGVAVFDVTLGTDLARNLVLLPNGACYVAGDALGNDPASQTGVAKLNPNGTLDTSFGTAGKLAILGANVGRGLARQPDGKLLLVGGTDIFPSSFAVVRLDANGSYDASFGNAGAMTRRISDSTTGEGDIAAAVALQFDGRILVAGKSGSINENFGLMRLNSNGSVDTTFGANGVSSVDFNGLADGAESLVIQGDGKIVMGGYATPTSSDGYGLARVHP